MWLSYSCYNQKKNKKNVFFFNENGGSIQTVLNCTRAKKKWKQKLCEFLILFFHLLRSYCFGVSTKCSQFKYVAFVVNQQWEFRTNNLFQAVSDVTRIAINRPTVCAIITVIAARIGAREDFNICFRINRALSPNERTSIF